MASMTAVSCSEPLDLGKFPGGKNKKNEKRGARELCESFLLHGDTLALNESSQMSAAFVQPAQLAGVGSARVEEMKPDWETPGGRGGHMFERMQESLATVWRSPPD